VSCPHLVLGKCGVLSRLEEQRAAGLENQVKVDVLADDLHRSDVVDGLSDMIKLFAKRLAGIQNSSYLCRLNVNRAENFSTFG
jgi:hypothetical protein